MSTPTSNSDANITTRSPSSSSMAAKRSNIAWTSRSSCESWPAKLPLNSRFDRVPIYGVVRETRYVSRVTLQSTLQYKLSCFSLPVDWPPTCFILLDAIFRRIRRDSTHRCNLVHLRLHDHRLDDIGLNPLVAYQLIQ